MTLTSISIRHLKSTGFWRATARVPVSPDVTLVITRQGDTEISTYRAIQEDAMYYRRKWRECIEGDTAPAFDGSNGVRALKKGDAA